ncbi:hypothetical protein EAE93_19755 [Photorhabdus akhurstii]|nr:hypothetical protein [Photorhabdus akhurstii]
MIFWGETPKLYIGYTEPFSYVQKFNKPLTLTPRKALSNHRANTAIDMPEPQIYHWPENCGQGGSTLPFPRKNGEHFYFNYHHKT